MPPKILIAPDKFKGTLTAAEAAMAIARGWRKVRPGDEVELLPVSDGGDGFGEVLSGLLHAKRQTIRTVDAAHRVCQTQWWWAAKSKTAIIESARVIGLAMLPSKKFHPFELDTFGLGAVIRAAAAKGARRCIVGIGGSATNDGGFGLALALGWKFFDGADHAIEQWTGLGSLTRIAAPKRRRWFAELIVAVDVQNPLLGTRGATRVYGPQKGLRRDDFLPAEKCLRRLAEVFARQFGGRSLHARDGARDRSAKGATRLHTLPGSGAAGGLGFAFTAFAEARLEPGFELFALLAKLPRRLRSVDLVITGEGCIDASTLMGKGVGQIARRCRELKLPCFALAGDVANKAAVRSAFARVRALSDLTAPAKAKARAAHWLERLAEETSQEAERR